MDAPTFTDLALRVISREATDDERRAVEAEMASTPARREEFEQLKRTHQLLRTAAPLTEAARATGPELPAWRVNELSTAVRQHFGPAANPKAEAGSTIWAHVLRWVFGGGGLAALTFAIVMMCFANRTVEVGLYSSDLVRGGEQSLSARDVPSARLVWFDEDTSFDQWQNQPLAWNQHAKIWVDNEHDLLYVLRRVRHGQIVMETQPLAPTDAAQREQIKQVVNSLQN